MMTFLNWVPPAAAVPPQYWKALAAMAVLVVGMVTFAQLVLQEAQAEQLQYDPSTETDKDRYAIKIPYILPYIYLHGLCVETADDNKSTHTLTFYIYSLLNTEPLLSNRLLV